MVHKRRLTEVVAGLCEDNEPVHTTAVRELEEETGLSTEVLIPIVYWVSPEVRVRKCMLSVLVDSEQAGEYGGLANEGEDIRSKWSRDKIC